LDQEPHERSGLERIAIRIGIYVGVFVAGGSIAFAYSFVPLHNAKNWKIDYLETRLEAKDERLRSAEHQLAAVQAEAADKPDSQTFKLLQDELASVDKTIKSLERDLSRAKRRVSELERSRNNWKKKHAAAESRIEALVSSNASPPPAEPATEPGATPPASPAPSAADDAFGPIAGPG
jgi:peptidoglycan hydrolase CwlO-like protein